MLRGNSQTFSIGAGRVTRGTSPWNGKNCCRKWWYFMGLYFSNIFSKIVKFQFFYWILIKHFQNCPNNLDYCPNVQKIKAGFLILRGKSPENVLTISPSRVYIPPAHIFANFFERFSKYNDNLEIHTIPSAILSMVRFQWILQNGQGIKV